MVMAGKIVVYTAITGSKDHLKDEQITGKADFICYSDKDIDSKIWTIRPACGLFNDDNRNAKIHKVLAHQYIDEYDYSIWIDGNIYLNIPPEELIERYLKNSDIAVFNHFQNRGCLYKEAETCIQLKRDDYETIYEQVTRYKEKGYPEDNGLYEGTVILRRHTNKVKAFNNSWWSEICRHSRRDQISFNFVLSQLNIRPEIMEGNIKDNNYFRRIPHNGHLKQKVPREYEPVKIREGLIDVIINRPTSYQGEAIVPGDRKLVPVRVAERWNTNGIAHYFNIEALVKDGELNTKSPTKYKFKKHPKVSIVVLVRNEIDYFKRCFESIHKYTSGYELIVIDNGAGQKTKDYLKSLDKFNLTVITNEENKGFSYGCDQGILVAKHDYICFLNSDTIVTPLWLDKLMGAFKKKDCGMVGPSTSFCGSIQSIKTVSSQRNKLSEKEINQIAGSLSEGTLQYGNLQGFCILIKKEILDKGGVFNYKRFKLGCSEETELLWRLRLLTGCQSYWVKDAYVHHIGDVVFKELGINSSEYNKKERAKWFKNKEIEGPQFVENDVEIKEKYVKKSIKQKLNRPRSLVLHETRD